MSWLIGVVALIVVIAAGVAIYMKSGGRDLLRLKEIRHFADLKGYYFAKPTASNNGYRMGGESTLGGDAGSNDWRAKWILVTVHGDGKDKTEIKSKDLPLMSGWLFVYPKSQAAAIKASQRLVNTDTKDPNVKQVAWIDAQRHAKEIAVGKQDFMDAFIVQSTLSDNIARRIISTSVQKQLLALPNSSKVSIRIGKDGIVATAPATFELSCIEKMISMFEILMSTTAQEQAIESASDTRWKSSISA